MGGGSRQSWGRVRRRGSGGCAFVLERGIAVLGGVVRWWPQDLLERRSPCASLLDVHDEPDARHDGKKSEPRDENLFADDRAVSIDEIGNGGWQGGVRPGHARGQRDPGRQRAERDGRREGLCEEAFAVKGNVDAAKRNFRPQSLL